MKLISNLREYINVTSLQKLQHASWSFPTAETILPYYIASLSGFVCATALGFVAAMTLMPPSPLSSTSASADVGPVTISLPERPRESDFQWITKRNIFDSTGSSEDAPKTACELVESQLPLKLTGLIYGGTAESSLVLLESTATKQADTFVMGDMVPGDARVVGIERTRVLFQRHNCPEYLDLQEPAPLKRRMAGSKPAKGAQAAATSDNVYREDGFEREGGTVKATKQWVDKALTVDFAKTLQDAKASPNMVNGEVKGFVLTRIRPDSVYEKMGLKDGDVIEAINGIELNDAARAIQTLNAVRNESNFDLQIKRDGQTQSMKLQVR